MFGKRQKLASNLKFNSAPARSKNKLEIKKRAGIKYLISARF
jgi:hypothetical protein